MNKKFIVPLLFVLISLTGMAQKNNGFIYHKDGIYIFILCKPQLDYELLGAVKNNDTIITKSRHERLNLLLEYCKREYPNSEAIIISDIKIEQADCIRLK